MCGIAGFVGSPKENEWHENFGMLTALLLTSQRRGRHATGFVSYTEPYRCRNKSAVLTDKQPLTASKFIQQSNKWKTLRHKRSSMVLLHNRFATHGDSENPDNLHPFQSHDQNLYLVHNGVIDNHLELQDSHKLKTLGKCDSEQLLRVIENHNNVTDGIDVCLKHSFGSMAIAVMDIVSEKLYLARNEGRPLWLMQLNNDLVYFASTEDILLESFEYVFGKNSINQIKMLIPIQDNYIFKLSTSGTVTTL